MNSPMRLSRSCGLFVALIILECSISSAEVSPYQAEWEAATVYLEVSDAARTDSVPATGSGFVISSQGYVLTVAHLFPENVGNYKIQGHSRTRLVGLEPLQVVHFDREYDLALLQFSVDAPRDFVRLGNPWQMKKNDDITALGYPAGLDLLSRQGKLLSTGGLGGRWIAQLSLSRGDSGGPIFNTDGAAVAIIQDSVADSDGLKVVRPLNFAKPLLSPLNIEIAAAPANSPPEIVSYAVSSVQSVQTLKTSNAPSEKTFAVKFPAKAGFKITDVQFEPRLLSVIKNPVVSVIEEGGVAKLTFELDRVSNINAIKAQFSVQGGDLVTKQRPR